MFIPLNIPPGMVQKGTEYQAKGRFYSGNLVRWREGTLRPIYGWQPHSASPVTGACRCVTTWRDNAGLTWIGLGTHSHLYAMSRAGVLSDITPTSFTVGTADATTGGGYGAGPYGAGLYGTPRLDTTLIIDATVWSLDTIGPFLVGVSDADQTIYEWDLNPAHKAAKITNSPVCKALVCTPDHMIMALAVGGDDGALAWSDQADNTIWTAAANNTAGATRLQTNGRLMCGRRTQGGTLIWTDVDVWLVTNLQNVLVYGFQRVGEGCGAISRNAAVTVNLQAYWMGAEGFYTYNGFMTAPLPCDVVEAVFGNMNAQQVSKVFGWHNSEFNEIWFEYPSAASIENDSYVAYSYKEEHWTTGQLPRTAACPKGVLLNPLMVGTDGIVYEHETGLSWGGALPYARSGPMELGAGDKVVSTLQLIPDDKTQGDVTATFFTRFYPEAPETVYGPYTLSSRTDIRFTARQIAIEYTATGPVDFRVGTPRIEAVAGGGR